MKMILARILILFGAFFCIATHAETLSEYVNSCKSELAFTTLPTNLNCYDGVLFDSGGGSPIHDFTGYAKINDSVDLVYACRWLFSSKLSPSNAMSLELMVHNRDNGKTCFFAAKDDVPHGISAVSPSIVSPTSSQAANYWQTPDQINNSDKCVNCHVAGPYIATPLIAPVLATYGLLNNGHDTFVDRSNPAAYKVVGATFSGWNTIVDNTIERQTAGHSMCSGGCHSIGSYSTTPNVVVNQFFLLKSISTVITRFLGGTDMPPLLDNSDYRWINRNGLTATGNAEYFAEAKDQFPTMFAACGIPTTIEAHAVSNPVPFTSLNPFQDKLEYFNLREGLKCLSANQADRSCNNYETHYLCHDDALALSIWTDWVSTTTANATGDDESRSRIPNLCANPLAIEARTTINGVATQAFGPNDRIASITPTSVVCNNADQPNGAKCENYVVRYSNCVSAPAPYNVSFQSVWTGKMLTATAAQNNAEARGQPFNSTWDSQKWIVRAVEGSNTAVRFKNLGMSRFLNSETNAEAARTLIYDLHADWTGEQWVIEPIAGSSQVRIKSVWTGKYLTVTDTSNYESILMQTLNIGWLSQRWIMQRL